MLTRLRGGTVQARAEEAVPAPPVASAAEPEPTPPPETPAVSQAAEPDWVDSYRRWIVESYGAVRILDMADALRLDDLYIPLTLLTPTDTAPDAQAVERKFVDVDEQARLDAGWRQPSGSSYADPREALLAHGHIAIVGDPGAGKTTMLRNLAVRLARNEVESLPALPIVIDLHELGRSPLLTTTSPDDVLTAWTVQRVEAALPTAHGVADWLRRRIEAGECVVLLDGLDEVAGTTDAGLAPYRIVLKALTGLATSFPNVPMVVTCRRAHLGRFVTVPKGFQIVETSEFEWEHISRFLDVWFRDNPATGEVLKSHLERSARMRGLTANPLLLALVCIIFQRRGSLPQRRADVYKRCVDVLLAEWDASRRRDRFPRFALEHKEDLLRRVAWQFHEQGLRYMDREGLIGIIAAFLPMIRLREESAEAILDEISAHHGLLKDHGHGWYGFHHFTLQEHFAVEHITSWHRLDRALALRNRNWWREIIRLYAGKGDCTELVCRLGKEREELFQSNLSLVAECLDEGSAVDPELLTHVRDELTRLAHNQSKPMDGRARATELIMRLIPDDDVSSLVKWLADDRAPIAGRLSALRLVVHGLGRHSASDLREMLSSSLDLGIREALATALGARVDGAELEPVIERISRERDAAAQHRLGCALGRGCADREETILPAIGREGVNLPVRLGLAMSLGQSARPGLAEAIRGRLGGVADPNVRAALELSLFALGDGSLADRARAMLEDRSVDLSVRIHAAEKMATLCRAVAPDVLWNITRDGTQERSVRIAAAYHLAGIADDAMRLALVELARDEEVDRFVRTAIIQNLGGSRSCALTGPLLGMLGDRSVLEYVRRAAVDALGALGDPEAVPPLLDLWRTAQTDQRIRARALVALGRIGTEHALREVMGELVNRSIDRNLRRACAEVLRPCGTAFDGEVLERACRWMAETDIPAALLTVIARFSAETEKTVYPEDVGMAPIEYPWACLDHGAARLR